MSMIHTFIGGLNLIFNALLEERREERREFLQDLHEPFKRWSLITCKLYMQIDDYYCILRHKTFHSNACYHIFECLSIILGKLSYH